MGKGEKEKKTYNTRDSPVVTDPTARYFKQKWERHHLVGGVCCVPADGSFSFLK
jgi:hypothetical protein